MSASHTFTVTVTDCDAEQAEQVMGERLGHDEDYGFDCRVDWKEPAATGWATILVQDGEVVGQATSTAGHDACRGIALANWLFAQCFGNDHLTGQLVEEHGLDLTMMAQATVGLTKQAVAFDDWGYAFLSDAYDLDAHTIEIDLTEGD